MGACRPVVLVHLQVKESVEIFIKVMEFLPGKGRSHIDDKDIELIWVQFEEIHGPPEHNNGLAE